MGEYSCFIIHSFVASFFSETKGDNVLRENDMVNVYRVNLI